jgi:coenzyme F420-reducing hydrogenase alpha subunit
VKNVKIDVHQVTRVEGHGNIVVNATDGTIEDIRWEIPESPRLFEVMLRGRYYPDVPYVASRICGICSIAHSTASIQAVEAAFDVKLTEQTQILRKLLFNSEILESHILHTLFLAAPDFLGVDSVFPLVETHKDVVVMAMNLKRLAYRFADAIAGRKTHPLSCIVGGFAKYPDPEEMKQIQAELKAALKDIDTVVSLFKSLAPEIPDFERETEYIALKDPKEYAWISGDIASSDAGITPLDNYLKVTNEFCVPQSTAKWTRNKRNSYMVGALARFNLNYDQLSTLAKKVARELNLSAPCHNPYAITLAQIVETADAFEDSIILIDRLLTKGIKEEEVKIKVKAGRGIGAVEAPRGILFHDYTFDADGNCARANCIIPTNQNHNNIQKDMEKLVPQIIKEPEDDIRQKLEMLVRAYDPCISCSAHMLKIRFKK